ncbi:ATP-binding cassette domain-containing protein [uncultured Enterococcus sp.]|uniref:ATP-binding cassette domain-containing protein n=1 Tax=uncultured Enterococcus sp. TaxID=167972 RepID=UPI002AA81C66|nr:ATP-binding cassette domain-containing protein [uncultured Enterococcus sp.]
MKIISMYKSINQNQQLNNINLTIKKGEIIGLIGRNGAGKTTLFRCLTNQYLPDQGSITINEKDIATHPELKEKIFLYR